MTIYDIVGNLRMFVNCNKGAEPCNLYMSRDTFDSICSVFQAASNALYPYDLGRSSGGSSGARIYGCAVVFKEDMTFGSIGIGSGDGAKKVIAVRMGDQAEYYKLLMGDI